MQLATHRDQLITMLAEAAEIEHCLMCTYLYAVFSLKQSVDEDLVGSNRTTDGEQANEHTAKQNKRYCR